MATPETPPILAPASPAPDQGGSGLPKSFDDLDTKRRGVKSGSTRGPYNKKPRAETPRPAPAVVDTGPALFTPEACKHLVGLPFNLAFVRTGYTGFCLSESESETLSASAATCLNTWVHIDPKWAALIVFSISLCGISAAKIMSYRVALAELEYKKSQAANAGDAPPAKVPEVAK